MIRSLKLKHFRQHIDTYIEFVPGINTIVGANNAGKSTIPEAIEFALFGAKALRDTGNSWITDGASSGNAILQLDVNNHIYKIGRDANAAKVYEGTELKADYKANVTKYVSQIAGVNHAGFRLGHYVRQKELAAFSALRPGKRQETIEKMLKIHAVDKVLNGLKERSDVLDAKLKGLLLSAQDADKLSDSLIEAGIERAALQPIVIDESPVIQIRKGLAVVREALATARAQKVELDRLLADVADYDNVVNNFDAAEQAYCLFEVKPVEAMTGLQTKLNELQQKEVLSAKMSTIKTELDKELVVVEKPIKPDATEHDKHQALISAADLNLKTARKLKGMTKCPTCLTDIADADALIKSLDDMHKNALIVGAPIIDSYKQAILDYAKIDRAYGVYLNEVNRRNELAAKYIDVDFSIDDKKQVENEIAEIHESNAEYTKLKHNMNMLEVRKNQLEKTKIRITELEEFPIPDGLEGQANSIAEGLRIAEHELKQLKDKAAEVAQSMARLDGRIQELQKAVDAANNLRQTISNTADAVSRLKYKYEVFQKFKKYLTAKIRPLIGTVAETLFHKVTKNRYASYQLSNDYEVIINTHQGFVRRLTTISGSENDLANLCLRLAISTLRSNRLISNLGFIILDEISSSFDEERTKQTLEGLMELKDIIPQIINITHKPVEMQFADKLITVKEINGKAVVV